MVSVEDYLFIRGKKLPVRLENIPHSKLKFWVENPRIYALLDHSGKQPNQEEIFEVMKDLEHVKELRQDILRNGGLMDPIIVREDDHIVFEGNSRLAAVRSLALQDPVKWETVRCKLVPSGASQEEIYALLGQYHIKGKKDWMPFEKAGFIYRRLESHKVPVDELANELGISQQEIQKFRRVYVSMQKHNEVRRDRWNHYWHMHTNRAIQKAIIKVPDLEDRIVELVQNDGLRAVDIRDKLPTICKADKIAKKFARGDLDFDDAHEDAKHIGEDCAELGRIKRFERWIREKDALEEMLGQNKVVRDKLAFSLGKVHNRISTILNQLEKRNNR